MTFRDPRYDILFQPLAIGPVTAKNRCNSAPAIRPETDSRA
jgi:2,4-dienoyl-CoA reductase-like NADH-dependent reductase (Old Yellow Enzyme family)